MFETILEFEPVVRLSFFLGVFVLIALWETAAPRRWRNLERWRRWPSNLGIVALNTVVLRVLFPVAAVAMAANASASGWGLFNLTQLPLWIEAILAVVILDVAIYMQHVMFHAVPVLWRLHRMHRVHHSVIESETNSNFGFNLSWWDRLFGTYRAQPEAGHDGMIIGINTFRSPDEQRLDKMLLQPFRKGGHGYAINAERRGTGLNQEKT